MVDHQTVRGDWAVGDVLEDAIFRCVTSGLPSLDGDEIVTTVFLVEGAICWGNLENVKGVIMNIISWYKKKSAYKNRNPN
jgi:hypothetical protein